MSRAQWNGTFRLHTPDPSHRTFGYCSCKQETKERYWGQQFCQMERAILPWVPEAFHPRFPDSETTHETKVPIVREKEPLVPRVGPFRSDRPKWPDVCTNRCCRNFGLNGKRLRCPLTPRTILAKNPWNNHAFLSPSEYNNIANAKGDFPECFKVFIWQCR